VNPEKQGTKVAAHYRLTINPGAYQVVRLRLSDVAPAALAQTNGDTASPFGSPLEAVLQARHQEADAFYADITPATLSADATKVTSCGSNAPFRSWSSTLPGGSTAKTALAGMSSRAASWGWTTSACLTAARRCRPVATWSRPTARPGWDCSASTDEIVTLYRNPEPDWVKQRGMLYFLPNHITLSMLRRIAQAGADGRLLAVTTTDLDTGTSQVFDLVAEAQHAVASGQVDRVHNIMLASAGIPGAFPFRMIDNELYVDGGVTGNIIYGGRIAEEDSLPAVWQHTYPTLPIPPIRYWVIFNNQFRPVPQVTAPNWPAVVQRSLETSTRTATATAVRHLFAMAEISRLKRKADIEVRVVSISGTWSPPVPGVFIKETMNNLADLGEKMGADPASWSSEPPAF
jgi:hypothetical protein